VRSGHSSCPSNEPSECFTQSEFNLAYILASAAYNATEEILISSLNLSGVVLEKDNPVYGHFERRHIDQYVMDQNRFTSIVISAIQSLKAERNLTKHQVRRCLRNITTTDMCKPIEVTCNVSTTR
jgi:hypothetical protein